MTADPDLLPSSVAAFTEALHGERGSLDAWLEVNDEREVRAHVEAYAHACVARATAAKDAEIEALRAEVERANGWNERVSVCRDHVADIVDGPCVICALDAAEARADKLRAEVERLTFEMERLQQQYDERTACMIVHRSTALACSDAVRAAYYEEHERAERLAEVLRLALNSHGKALLTDPPQDAWKVNRVEEIGRALLRDQEEGHEQ